MVCYLLIGVRYVVCMHFSLIMSGSLVYPVLTPTQGRLAVHRDLFALGPL